MARDISNSDDVVDSRDVIKRIEELQSDFDELVDEIKELWEPESEPEPDDVDEIEDYNQKRGGAIEALREWLEPADTVSDEDLVRACQIGEAGELLKLGESDEAGELKVLLALAEEAEGYASDWPYGAALIRESYFETYCQELCEEIGDMPKGFPSYMVIDWEATARNIRQDYTEVDWDGVPYLIR